MNKKFSTFDMNLSVTLFTLGYKLLELDKTNPKKVRFVFKEEKDIEQTMLRYWNDEITVSALSLLNNLKTLKNMLYSNNE